MERRGEEKGPITGACLYALIERIRGLAGQRDAAFPAADAVRRLTDTPSLHLKFGKKVY